MIAISAIYQKMSPKYQLTMLSPKNNIIKAEVDKNIPKGNLDPIFFKPNKSKIVATTPPII